MSNHVADTVTASGPLVVFPGALGDFVCFLPALAAIARHGSPALLVKQSLAPLVVAAALGDPRPLEGPAGSWLFSPAPPPEAEAFFRRFPAIECFTGAGVAEVESNLRRWKGAAARLHPFRPETPRHLAIHFLERVGAPAADLPEARLRLPDALLARVRRARLADTPREQLLVLHPGSGGRAKRWAREGFARVAARWSTAGGAVLVVLGPAEGGERAYWDGRGLLVVEPDALDELAALLAAGALYLGNDSGASHLAAAIGAAGIALFGPTDERLWRPPSRRLVPFRPPAWSALEDEPPESAIDAVESALYAAALAGTSP